MKPARLVVVMAVAALAPLVAGCETDSSRPSGSAGSPTASATAAKAPAFKMLDGPALSAALLTMGDMPTGYSEDPDTGSAADKTFCNYTPPNTPTTKASKNFIKGAGRGSEFTAVGLRQYAGVDQATASFDALVTAMQTCHEETVGKQKYTYAVMSMPKVGDKVIGIRISTESATILQGFALSGPTIVNAGVGGLVNVPGDLTADLLTKQVGRYTDAAKG